MEKVIWVPGFRETLSTIVETVGEAYFVVAGAGHSGKKQREGRQKQEWVKPSKALPARDGSASRGPPVKGPGSQDTAV